MAASFVTAAAGCAATSASTTASPSPERAAPTATLAPDACRELTAADVHAAIGALPGWSYDYWSTGWRIDGTPQPGFHTRVAYIKPDRLREEAFDTSSIRHGQVLIGDRQWVYAGLPAARDPAADTPIDPATQEGPSDPAALARELANVAPFEGRFMTGYFPFAGDLPGDGLSHSPRVADTECLAIDLATGTSLVTTRSGQLVRMTSEKRLGQFIEMGTLIFHATTPLGIEAPSAADMRTEPFIPEPARPRLTDPR